MKRTRQLALYLLPFLLAASLFSAAYAQQSPFSLEADVIEYNAKTGMMSASGSRGVKVMQANLVMTGQTAVYNTQTGQGVINGGVEAVQGSSRLTASQIQSFDNNQRLLASGNVVMTKEADKLYAPQLEYFPDRQYAIATGGAKMLTADSVITADRIENFAGDGRSVAKGDVHILSDARELEARADEAAYYAPRPQEQGKVVLTGNARAVQQGNTVIGQAITLYLDDKAMDAAGRTRLTLIPGSM
ncbi:LptA/OstA family protein [Acetonema longum]|uniref:OstA family protein n=1 Tax=Acetonema longum DSM 6540 TaxID=1009370 RepID=F7NLZ9_9FIRM|nr:LptA/OstA family protein [Acetonema longum]EGO62925.1 OstA family protein [Acetonema longum DSM 6540]